jgi:hypothetical protein
MQGFVVGMVAFGTQWPMIDLPYPDVTDGSGAPAATVSPEQQVEAAICRHAHLHTPLGHPVDVSQLRIDGTRATALVTTGSRVEWVHLEQVGGEWKVVQTFAHR